MLRRFTLLSPLLIVAGLWPIGALGQSRTELVGSWEGSIRMQGVDQAVTLVVEDDDGELVGVIDIPDQDAVLRRVASIQIRDQYFSFEVEGAAGAPAFDGAIAPDGNGLSGNFVLEGRIYRFELARRAVRDASTDAPTLEGAWEGTLDAGGLTLEIRLNVPAEPGGRVVMSIGAPGQAAIEYEVDTLAVEGSEVRLGVQTLGAFYVAELTGDGAAMSGTWRQGDARIELTLRGSD